MNSKNIIVDNERNNDNVDCKIIQDFKMKDVEQEMDSSKETENKSKEDTVIIVEDNPELLEILENLFSPLYNVITAVNGQDALDKIKSNNVTLVVSDVMMPIMTGTELCSKIKKDIKLSHIPVVLLTALNMQEQYLDGLLKGADDYISKPFDTKILLARCNNIVRSRKVLYKQISGQKGDDISLIATNTQDKEFIERVIVIINARISDSKLSNDDIAADMNMSRSSFYNKFKGLTGETPNEFINAYRLKQATHLLLSSDGKTIAEISDILGFNTPNYFCRKFKETYNVSPSQYKNKDSLKE